MSMKDKSNTKEQLIKEITETRQRVAKLEKSEAKLNGIKIKLKKPENHYQIIFDSIGDAIHIIDRELRIVLANRAFTEWLSVIPVRADIVGLTVFEAFPFLQETVRDEYEQVFKTGKPLVTEDCNILDGRTIYTESRKIPIMEKNRVVQVITIIRDITERKQAEIVLQESEELNTKLIHTMPDIIMLTNLNGDILFVNNVGLRESGYQDTELIGQNMLSFVAPEDQDNAVRNTTLILEGKRLGPREYNLIMKGGKKLLFEINGDVLRNKDGSPYGMIRICRNITDRKQAEEALLVSEEKFSKAFHKAPLLMSINEIEDGTYLDVNEKWTEVSGFSREETIGKTSMELGFMSREDAILLAKKLKHQQIVENMEVYLQNKNKQQVCCLFSSEIITIGGKQLLLCLSQDITEKKKTEEEKRRLEERLQRAEKMEALGTLAGGVAHDLNNVLGVIVGYSELLLNEVDKTSSIRPRLEKIMGGSEKAATIVQDLLTLARRGVPGRKVLNLNKIVLDYQNSPELEKLSSYHSSVRINLDLEPNLLNINGSSVHLNKTLSNLVSNAAEAMPKGGDLIIKTANQYLDKPIQGYEEIREGDYVILSVTDTGEGIPSSDIQRIFEPFYTKKVMGRSGTGLGLAVIWGTVKDHQGYINVQSEEGKGSTFTLYFPVTREEISVESASASISEYMSKGETILVIDDVREQRDLAAEMLKKLNYQVSSVASGEEAIAYLKELKVDLLVLDMIMDPGMDGLDTYKSILQIHPKQKAIIVSGFSESERVKEAQMLGAGAYVKKPYVIENIGMAIRKELDKK
jgi:two-component system, cell cycle sensor histidine kinase and response regulator CckA